jgi:hypothetical protein
MGFRRRKGSFIKHGTPLKPFTGNGSQKTGKLSVLKTEQIKKQTNKIRNLLIGKVQEDEHPQREMGSGPHTDVSSTNPVGASQNKVATASGGMASRKRPSKRKAKYIISGLRQNLAERKSDSCVRLQEAESSGHHFGCRKASWLPVGSEEKEAVTISDYNTNLLHHHVT